MSKILRDTSDAYRTGADALVLFNRFLQPDIDPDTLAAVPQVGAHVRQLSDEMRACGARRGLLFTREAHMSAHREEIDEFVRRRHSFAERNSFP